MRDIQYLYDILESTRLAVSYITGKIRATFLSDIQCQDAVNRRIMIIGEAANCISAETRQTLNHLLWRQMLAMQNIVVHEYANVNLGIVWDTLQNDLPPLVTELEKVVPSEESNF